MLIVPFKFGAIHRNLKAPPSIYVPTTPKISKKNAKSTKISNIKGNEFKIVVTNELIPGIELIVFKGLSNLITLMELIFELLRKFAIQPNEMTMKSRKFHGSLW